MNEQLVYVVTDPHMQCKVMTSNELASIVTERELQKIRALAFGESIEFARGFGNKQLHVNATTESGIAPRSRKR